MLYKCTTVSCPEQNINKSSCTVFCIKFSKGRTKTLILLETFVVCNSTNAACVGEIHERWQRNWLLSPTRNRHLCTILRQVSARCWEVAVVRHMSRVEELYYPTLEVIPTPEESPALAYPTAAVLHTSACLPLTPSAEEVPALKPPAGVILLSCCVGVPRGWR